MELSSYTSKKSELKSALQYVSDVAKALKANNQAKEIQQDIQLLDKEKFEMVVVGEFSRGKSTFVNAMLGRRILPSSVKPTTAIISKIVYGEKPQYYLYYKDANQTAQQVSEDEFFSITAPQEADASDKDLWEEYVRQQGEVDKIDFAEIAYPLSFCRDNVEVVDTPGTNDLNVGRMEITYRYLNRADAVILLLAADQALSASESAFLQERILGNQIQDLFFVINRKDMLSGPTEEQQVLDFVRKNLREKIPNLPC